MGSIYRIWNTITKKSYVGQTTGDLASSMLGHLSSMTFSPGYRTLDKGTLAEDALEYGPNTFCCEILEANCPNADLDKRKRQFIEKFNSFNNGYNRNAGGGTNSATVPDRIINPVVPLSDARLRKAIEQKMRNAREEYERSQQPSGEGISGTHNPTIPLKRHKELGTQLKEFTRQWTELDEALYDIRGIYAIGEDHINPPSEISNAIAMNAWALLRGILEELLLHQMPTGAENLNQEELLRIYSFDHEIDESDSIDDTPSFPDD